MRALLAKGAKTACKRPSDLSTPLHLSLAAGHPNVVRMLVEKGASVDALNKAGQVVIVALPGPYDLCVPAVPPELL